MARWIVLILEDKGASDVDLAYNRVEEFTDNYEPPPMTSLRMAAFADDAQADAVARAVSPIPANSRIQLSGDNSVEFCNPEEILPSEY